MSEQSYSGASDVDVKSEKSIAPGLQEGGENEFELSGNVIKADPDEVAPDLSDSSESHPSGIDSGDQFSSNIKMEPDAGDQYGLNIKTEPDSYKTELYDPVGSDISETEVSEAEYDLPAPGPSVVRIKSEPADDYELEPGYTLPPCSTSEEWEGAGSDLGPVPVSLIPAAGSRGLLRIDVEDPLHPVPSGAVKEEPFDEDMEESSYGFGEGTNADDQNMESEDDTVPSFEPNGSNPPRPMPFIIYRSDDVTGYKHHLHSGESSYACDQCVKVFKSSSKLNQHKLIHLIHAGERPFACDQCEKTFKRNFELNYHKRLHTGERPFACDQCKKTFRKGFDLKRHKLIHSGENKFVCDQCDKAFSQRSSLNRHKQIHTGEKLFACDQCDKTFARSSVLKIHQRIHTGERPFTCDQCDKSFVLFCHLTEHKRLHTGEKPFACDQCVKTFRRRCDLTEHRLIHTGEKPFTCDQCLKTFRRSCDLTQHRLIHSGEKKFACEQCDKTFTQSSALSQHKHIHRKEALQCQWVYKEK